MVDGRVGLACELERGAHARSTSCAPIARQSICRSGGLGPPPAVSEARPALARGGQIPCNQAVIWRSGPKTGMEGRFSKHALVWQRIRELLAERFGKQR